MLRNKGLWGAMAGALIAIVWVAFDGGAVLLVAGLATVGWIIGMVLERPDGLIALLQRLQDR